MRPAALALALLVPLSARADDGAASIAAGGLILMKREPRITMAKEVLRIGPGKVVVDYDFRNDSDQDITTLVAFPVPTYKFGDDRNSFGDPAFSDFQLSIGNKPARFSIEARAFVGRREITAVLRQEHIDIASFGHWDKKEHDYSVSGADYQRASAAAQQKLIRIGAYDKDREPNWNVQKKYYWTQTFPAHATIHIQHQYSPALGGSNSMSYGLLGEEEKPRRSQRSSDEQYTIEEVTGLCLDSPLKARMLKMAHEGQMVPFNYVDFILTTANTWKTPIEDFTLIVDRPSPSKEDLNHSSVPPSKRELVSFCWAGPVEKTDEDHFTAHVTDFVPTKELRIGFLHPGDAYKDN